MFWAFQKFMRIENQIFQLTKQKEKYQFERVFLKILKFKISFDNDFNFSVYKMLLIVLSFDTIKINIIICSKIET